MSTQYDARFSGYIKDAVTKRISYSTHKRNITVFALSREEAIDEVMRQANLHGFVSATIDHINEVGK